MLKKYGHTLIPINENENKVLQSRRENEKVEREKKTCTSTIMYRRRLSLMKEDFQKLILKKYIKNI